MDIFEISMRNITTGKEAMVMCPKHMEGICEIVGIEPEFLECTDGSVCATKRWETCPVYIADILTSCENRADSGAVMV